jgi:ABC-type bacteriocin/lantibiotic exporter with double-glycine peptidase domain
VATVAAHYGRGFDVTRWSSALSLEGDGTDLLSLSQLAERLGFDARGVKAAYDAIPDCTLPAIAHWRRPFRGGHFVVVHRWTPKEVVVADPAIGIRRVSRHAFCRRSTGYFLLLQPT